MGKVLVVSVHPDDETLGCGGSLLRHKSMGDYLYWLILTNVRTEDGWDSSLVENRQNEILKVSEIYEFDKVISLDFPTMKLDEIPIRLIIKNISDVINDLQPTLIYLNNRSDIHSDHKVAFNAVISCTKNFRTPYIQKIYMYECLSETEFAPALSENTFIPNTFIDITEFIERKLEIMSVYFSEIMPENQPRSHRAIKSLAAYRGSRIGVDYAEAFSLIFEKVI